MKIAVISLLRIGDLIMSMPAIRGLADANPGAKVKVIVNSQFLRHTPLFDNMGGRVEFVGFPRDILQDALGNIERPLREGERILNQWVVDLEADSPFDLVVNLTHNRLSGLLGSLINARERRGLTFDEMGRAVLSAAWVRQMNLQADGLEEGAFHFVDLVQRVAGNAISGNELDWGLTETSAGLIESSRVFPGRTDIIALQAFTSDIKKDWGLARFLELEELLRRRWPTRPLVYLGCGDEITRLKAAFAGRPDPNRAIVELSLPGVLSLLKRSQGLVTGDTSIKHLAAAIRCPILEIALGPSQPSLTGAATDSALIIASREPCQPCVPSSACHRSFHACSSVVEPEAVALLVQDLVDNAGLQVERIANEYCDTIQLQRLDRRGGQFFVPIGVAEAAGESVVVRLIDQFVRCLYLDQADRLRVDRGTEIDVTSLRALLVRAQPDVPDREWKFHISDLERQLSSFVSSAESLRRGVKSLAGRLEDRRAVTGFVMQMRAVRSSAGSSLLLKSLTSQFEWAFEDDISQAFVRLRRIVDTVQAFERRAQLTKRVLEELRHAFEEHRAPEEQI